MLFYKNFLIITAIMSVSVCSIAMADSTGLNEFPIKCERISYPVQDVNQFDISSEISVCEQALIIRNNAILNCDGSEETIKAIFQQYENVKKQQLAKIKNRLFDQKKRQNVFEVHRYGEMWADNARRFDRDYRLDCPKSSELVLIPGTCRLVEHSSAGFKYVKYTFKENNNGCTVHFHVDNHFPFASFGLSPVPKHGCWAHFSIIAHYRYNDAILTKMTNADMVRLRERLEAALKEFQTVL